MNRRPHSEGEEFSLHNLEQWCVISPLRGDVLFVDLRSTDYGLDEEVWAPFLVMEVALLKALGTLSIEAKFLGGCISRRSTKKCQLVSTRRVGRHSPVRELRRASKRRLPRRGGWCPPCDPLCYGIRFMEQGAG